MDTSSPKMYLTAMLKILTVSPTAVSVAVRPSTRHRANIPCSTEAREKLIKKFKSALFLTDARIDRQGLIHTKGDRVRGTCEWIRADAVYQDWLEGDSPMVWISGGPGRGKTMLSIFLTAELETNPPPNAQLMYYFCTAADENRSSATCVLRSLLYQLLALYPHHAAHFLEHFRTAEELQKSVNYREALWSCLSDCLQDSSLAVTYCVLDGLDECDAESRQWLVTRFERMMRSIRARNGTASFRLVIVSRDISGLQRCPRIKLDPDHDRDVGIDIEAVVTARLDELTIDSFDVDAYDNVKQILIERSEGTFLWVGLVMVELSNKSTYVEVLATLSDLPKGLTAIYDRMLLRIEEKYQKSAALLLLWVALAQKPFDHQELADAIDARPTAYFDAQDVVRYIITLCGSFVQSDHKGRIRFVHHTAREYLLQARAVGHEVLAELWRDREKAEERIVWRCLDVMAGGSSPFSSTHGKVALRSDSHSAWMERPLITSCAI